MNEPATSSGTPPVIEFHDAAIGPDPLSGEAVLEGVNWRVTAGDWWVVGGLHWSGKSALLATAGGVQRPMRGAHFLFGDETGVLREEELLEHRRRVGIVFDNGGRLFTNLSIAENVALPICYHRDCAGEDAAERVAELLETMGLAGLARQTPDCISRSWRQRVGLARALALEPDVLLLDNPLAGLPPPERVWWLELIERLHDGHAVLRGKPVTLALTTDDLQPWTARGRRFALLHDGRWRSLGGVDELRRCADPLVHELLAAGLTRN